MLLRARSSWCRVAVSARAGKERWCCLLCSCRLGAFGAVLQFQLVQAMSVGVAIYARADQERWFVQFRLVRTRSFVPCSLGSCRRGASCPTV
ncbi:hypothetical protein EV1_023667 [Malus domestica]